MDGTLIRSAYNNIKTTGKFTRPCYSLNQIKSVDQSFTKLQIYFTKADRDRQGEATAVDLGQGIANCFDCHGSEAGARTTVGMGILTLTEDVTQQNAANVALFAKIIVVMSVVGKHENAFADEIV